MATPSLTNINQKNEFLGSLVNKIGRQEYASKAYLNPLSKFKKGFIDNANEIEEIYVARVQGLSQDLDGTTTLKRVKPDVKTLYHNQEYGKCYTATITDKQVRQAFTSKDGVKRIADEILTQQHTGVEYDEYVAMKKAINDFATAIPGSAKRTITEVTNQTTAKEFVKKVKKDIGKMQFRSTNYCEYEQHSKAEDLVLFIHIDYQAEIDVELLATAFNIDKAELNTRVVYVDGFANTKLRAVLLDVGAIKVFDTLYNNEQQRNAQGMFTNYHLNVEKIVSYSTLYNGASYSIA